MATKRMTSSSSDCATMMISGQRYTVQSSAKVIVLLRRGHGGAAFGERRAFGHHRGRPRDRVGEIVVVDDRAERRLVGLALHRRKRADVGGAARHDLADAGEMRPFLEQRLA